MADNYSKWVMTPKFANNMQAAASTGHKIDWVRIVLSSDTHTFADLASFNDTTLATATVKQSAPVSTVVIKDNTATITAVFTNTANTADYYIKTMFLVGRYNGAEFLAGAAVANTPFRMPAASPTEITEFTARPQITVTNSNTISTTVDPVAAATNGRVDTLEENLQGQIDDINTDKQSLWQALLGYVSKTASETIGGVKTFTSTIIGSITGNAGTATKWQTTRKINVSGDVVGTAQNIDGTANVTVPTTLASVTRTDTTSSEPTANGDSVTIVDSVTTDSKGRTTGINLKTITLPPAQTSVTGNAGTATKLATARTIGGVAFDGTANINLPGVNVGGNQPTTGNAASATKLQTARSVGGVLFDGTANINLPGVNSVGNQNTTGNAATATKLQTARTINGTSFDGTANISVNAANDADLMHKSGTETVPGHKDFTGGISVNNLEISGDGSFKVYGNENTDPATYINVDVKNGFAVLNGWFATAAILSDDGVILANLPLGARPKATIYVSCLFRPDGLDGGVADLTIFANGNITVNDVYSFRSDSSSFAPGARVHLSGLSYPVA